MRIPTFSRQSATDTTDDDGATAATGTAPVRERTDNLPPPPPPHAGQPEAGVRAPSDATTTRWTGPQADDRDAANRAARVDTAELRAETADRAEGRTFRTEADADRTADLVPAGPKPRASLLATLGLICGVAAALLVLSGPLLAYGVGVAVLALVLSLGGIRATRRRHVAGKTDALIGMVLALGAIVVGVLALTGSLSWLGTDMQPVSSLRDWLDTNIVNRF